MAALGLLYKRIDSYFVLPVVSPLMGGQGQKNTSVGSLTYQLDKGIMGQLFVFHPWITFLFMRMGL